MTAARHANARSIALFAASTAVAGRAAAPKDLRLVEAAKAGNSAARAVALLQKKVDPNAAEPDGTTALHWAVRNNDATLVDRLITPAPRQRARTATASRRSRSPAKAAARHRRAPAQGRASAPTPPARWARRRCTPARTRATSKRPRCCSPPARPSNAGDNWRGQTPLMWAAARGHAEMVRVLIEAGADVNARSTIIDLGAAAHRGAARQVAAAGRPDAAAVRRARRQAWTA